MQPRRARTGKSSSKSSRNRPRRLPNHSPVEVKLGVVARAHGLRGELRVEVDPSTQSSVREDSRLRLVKVGDSGEFRVERVRRAQRGLVLTLEGVTDRNAAEQWAGADVLVARDALSSQADTYFDFELVGLEVRSETGDVLGTVTEVVATGANDVIVVASERGELLVPAIPGAVLAVDTAMGRVTVDERTVVRDEARSR